MAVNLGVDLLLAVVLSSLKSSVGNFDQVNPPVPVRFPFCWGQKGLTYTLVQRPEQQDTDWLRSSWNSP